MQKDQEQLRVTIVSIGGPYGKVAALGLHKYGVPFVILERAYRSNIFPTA
jgi:2-polyprenyl-6-methoxyphenol hydroxylase-like FAD-dependent oxidoreductase